MKGFVTLEIMLKSIREFRDTEYGQIFALDERSAQELVDRWNNPTEYTIWFTFFYDIIKKNIKESSKPKRNLPEWW